MKCQKALFSKASDEWETPQWLYDRLDREFKFALDAAATEKNTKAFYYHTKDCDPDLKMDWRIPRNNNEEGGNYHSKYHSVFLNPPYSKIAAFSKKAYEEHMKGVVIAMLIPCRTDTSYWHEYIMKAQEIRFIRGRLKFNKCTLPSWRENGSHKVSSATFPSCIVIFTRWHEHYWNQDRSGDILPIMGKPIWEKDVRDEERTS